MYPKGYHTFLQDRYMPGDPITGRPRLRHAPYSSRTLSEVNYYIIDFGGSRKYPSGSDASIPLTFGVQGHLDAPEMCKKEPYDPMLYDVYCFGSTFTKVLEVSRLAIESDAPHVTPRGMWVGMIARSEGGCERS
jgi:hypothetical protein